MKKLILTLLSTLMLAGCMGTGALATKVKKFNLDVTEHRWGREGTFLALNILWVYRIANILDLLVFNSIEFWSGENPVNGKSPLVDIPKATVEKMGLSGSESAQIQRIDENNATLAIYFDNGDKLTFDVVRTDNSYTVSYLGKEFFSGTIAQLDKKPNDSQI